MEVLNLTAVGEAGKSFAARVGAEAGTDVYSCYQCGKCSAGCPLSYEMDFQPRQIMRLVQLGLKDLALKSSTIWLCASCATCTTRCPREVKIASVMDVLRAMARREGYPIKEKGIAVFHRNFLNTVAFGGRSYELGMILGYKLGTLPAQPLKDLDLGFTWLQQGKLKFIPERIKDAAAIREIFSKTREIEQADLAKERAQGSGPETGHGAGLPAGGTEGHS
ncbi:MAG TPA: 4Fe-4S dicluster domain-containing protein [Bacillota bacterium]